MICRFLRSNLQCPPLAKFNRRLLSTPSSTTLGTTKTVGTTTLGTTTHGTLPTETYHRKEAAFYNRYIRLRKSRKYRVQTNRAVIAGSKLIDELFHRTAPPFIHRLYLDATQPEWERKRWEKKAEHATQITQEVGITTTVHPSLSRGSDFPTMTGFSGSNEGVAAEIDLPVQLTAQAAATLVNKPNSRVLVLDALQDPGNVGTLIRTAYLFGWDLVCLGSGSVDVSNDKVLRASGGTVFDQPVYGGPINGLITEITKQCQHPVQYLVADHGVTGGGRGGDSAQGNGSSMSSQNVQLVHNSTVVLVLGNEGNGVCTPTPKEIRDPTTITVTTRESTVGSLGVASAGSILMRSLNVAQKHEKKTKKKKEKKLEKNEKKRRPKKTT